MKRILTPLFLVLALSVAAISVDAQPVPTTQPAVTQPVIQPAAPAVVPATEVAVPTDPTVAGAKTPDDVGVTQVPGLVISVVTAIKNKNWTLLTGSLIMLLTFFLNLFWLKRMGKDKLKIILPWVTVGAGFLLQFAACLISGEGWLQAVNTAFVTGASAAGLWSLGGKLILGRFLPTPSPQPAVVKP